MKTALPRLIYGEIVPTRDYLRETALVLSALQRGFLPKHPRQWQYGLEVGMRGPVTQAFVVQGTATRASLDLVRYKVRLGDEKWALGECSPPEIFAQVKLWLAGRGVDAALEEPAFQAGVTRFDTAMASAYAEALWWMHEQFSRLKTQLAGGVSSPVLLYPHHFDLALAWFPRDDERQLSLGWSTGDQAVPEPYVYFSVYPEPQAFSNLALPKPAYWQPQGFSGAILLYRDLVASKDPAALLGGFAQLFQASAPLMAKA